MSMSLSSTLGNRKKIKVTEGCFCLTVECSNCCIDIIRESRSLLESGHWDLAVWPRPSRSVTRTTLLRLRYLNRYRRTKSPKPREMANVRFLEASGPGRTSPSFLPRRPSPERLTHVSLRFAASRRDPTSPESQTGRHRPSRALPNQGQQKGPNVCRNRKENPHEVIPSPCCIYSSGFLKCCRCFRSAPALHGAPFTKINASCTPPWDGTSTATTARRRRLSLT